MNYSLALENPTESERKPLVLSPLPSTPVGGTHGALMCDLYPLLILTAPTWRSWPMRTMRTMVLRIYLATCNMFQSYRLVQGFFVHDRWDSFLFRPCLLLGRFAAQGCRASKGRNVARLRRGPVGLQLLPGTAGRCGRHGEPRLDQYAAQDVLQVGRETRLQW